MITKKSPIAVVDSGMGGITVLKKLYRILAAEFKVKFLAYCTIYILFVYPLGKGAYTVLCPE